MSHLAGSCLACCSQHGIATTDNDETRMSADGHSHEETGNGDAVGDLLE